MSSSHRIGFEYLEKRRPPKSRLQAYLKLQQSQPASGRVVAFEEGGLENRRDRLEQALSRHTTRYVVFQGHVHTRQPPGRFDQVLARLDELEGASEASASAARAHVQLVAQYCALGNDVPLAEPWIGIGDDGSVGLDWRHDGRRLAITFPADGGVEFYLKDALGESAGQASRAVEQMQLVTWLVFGRGLPSST